MLPPPPAELSHIQPFLLRANELQTKDPVMSYFCRFHAAKTAIEQGLSSAESKTFVLSLMDLLEKEKAALAGNEAITNDMASQAYVENFAERIFLKADNEDRAGKATMTTAKTFLAASTFLQVLKCFGELEPETANKIKYAKFKAVDITKAIKEGRVPKPGPPDEEPAESPQPSSANNTNNGQQSSMDVDTSSGFPVGGFAQQPPSYSSQPTVPFPTSQPQPDIPTSSPYSPPQHQQQPDNLPMIPQLPSVPQTLTSPSIASQAFAVPPPQVEIQDLLKFDPKVIQQAQKHARFVISALQYDDVKTAIENLEKALEILGPYRRQS